MRRCFERMHGTRESRCFTCHGIPGVWSPKTLVNVDVNDPGTSERVRPPLEMTSSKFPKKKLCNDVKI